MSSPKPQDETNDPPVVVVTGSSSGIGKAIAWKFAEHNFRLAVHATSFHQTADQTLNELKNLGAETQFFPCDFSENESKLEEFFQRVSSCYEKIDCWVNCAGADVLTTSYKDQSFLKKLDYLWKVDVRSSLIFSKLAGDCMRAQPQGGSIINIGWDGADSGLPGESGQLFAATKGAIHGMTKSLSQSFGSRVRVNCIAPGWIKTKWGNSTDKQWEEWVKEHSASERWGDPKDIADLAFFLGTDQSSYINGQVIPVNGGTFSAFGHMKNRLLGQKEDGHCS